MEKERFSNIDFLRFIGAIIIVYFHVNICGLFATITDYSPIIAELRQKASFGGFWVDFFFIISGFFFFRYTNFFIDFWEFFKKKIIRLLPVIIFAVALYWLLAHFTELHYQKYINIFTMLLLNNIGLTGRNMGNIHPTWFVSALFWTQCLYFYLTKIFDKKYINLLMGIIPFFAFVFITNTTQYAPKVFYHFINIGILKAMGGLALGYWINELYNKVNHTLEINKNFHFIIKSAIEIYLFIFIIYNTSFHKLNFPTNSYCLLVLAFCLLFFMFIIRGGILSKLLENKFSVLCGSFSYSIFVTHIIVLDLLRNCYWKHKPEFIAEHLFINVVGAIYLSVLLGIVVHYVIEKPAAKYLSNKWLNKNLEKEIVVKWKN